MSEALRDEALALTRAVLAYIAECERRGVPPEESIDVRERIGYVLRWAYE